MAVMTRGTNDGVGGRVRSSSVERRIGRYRPVLPNAVNSPSFPMLAVSLFSAVPILSTLCCLVVARDAREEDGITWEIPSVYRVFLAWALLGSNQRPLPCEGNSGGFADLGVGQEIGSEQSFCVRSTSLFHTISRRPVSDPCQVPAPPNRRPVHQCHDPSPTNQSYPHPSGRPRSHDLGGIHGPDRRGRRP